MKQRAFRRKREGKIRRPRGRHAVAADRNKPVLTIVPPKCHEPHPHRDCPATCMKRKGHLGKHVGYVFKGRKDKKTGELIVERRVEVHWTDKEAKAWARAQEEAAKAGARAIVVRSTDGREWREDQVVPAEE